MAYTIWAAFKHLCENIIKSHAGLAVHRRLGGTGHPAALAQFHLDNTGGMNSSKCVTLAGEGRLFAHTLS